MIFALFIKGPKPVPFFSRSIPPSPSPSSNTQDSGVALWTFNHVRSNLQGRWIASYVTEEDIKKLREAIYLTAEISHRLPARG